MLQLRTLERRSAVPTAVQLDIYGGRRKGTTPLLKLRKKRKQLLHRHDAALAPAFADVHINFVSRKKRNKPARD